MNLQRRDVMKAAAAVPLASIAGCTDVLGDDPPAYSETTPRDGADEESGVFFIHIDGTWLREYDGQAELPYADELPDGIDIDPDPETAPVDIDPLVAYPTAGLLGGALAFGLGLWPYGFGDEILASFEELPDEADPDDGQQDGEADGEIDGDVRVDSMLFVDGIGVFRGSFDTRTIVAAADDFEPTAERHGFDIYEGTDDGFLGTEGLGFAIQDDFLVVLLDEDSSLDAVLESHAGETDRLSDDDDGGWALAEAGSGHVTLGAWDTDPTDEDEGGFVGGNEALDDAIGLVSSLTLGPEEGTGALAAVYPEGETPEQAAFENQVGTSASSRELSVDGTRVSVSGVWRVPEE